MCSQNLFDVDFFLKFLFFFGGGGGRDHRNVGIIRFEIRWRGPRVDFSWGGFFLE